MAAQPKRGQLAQRGQIISEKQSLPYFNDFFKGLQNLWTPSNPAGHILMAVAENHQNYAPLQKKLTKAQDKRMQTSGYCSMRGDARFLAAFAKFVEASICSGVAVDPALLTAGTGCGSLFDHITHCICQEGDAVLVPSPMYAAFLNDCGVKAGARVVPCPMDTPQWSEAAAAAASSAGASTPQSLPRHELSTACLQAGYDAAVQAGSRPRMLILVNPGNPTGGCFTPSEMNAAIAWARKNALHVIVDEVYAAGVHYSGKHDPSSAGAVPFVSAMQLLQTASTAAAPTLGDDVHVMWGFSKDWGVSGFRIGVLYSQNEQLNSALSNVGYFSAVSNYTQEAMAEVLEDTQWCKEYMRSNADLVGGTFSKAVSALKAAGVPCMPADGGMYVWVDLRKALPPVTAPVPSSSTATMHALTEVYKRDLDSAGVPWEAETLLCNQLFQEQKVLLTPGRACCSSLAGFFRVCITWMDEAGTLEGIRRIAAVYAAAGAGGGKPAGSPPAGNHKHFPGSGRDFSADAKL